MGRVSLYGFDEIGNEVMATLQLHVDLGPSVFNAITHPDEAVVLHDHVDHHDSEDGENDKKRHSAIIARLIGPPSGSGDCPVSKFLLSWVLGAGPLAPISGLQESFVALGVEGGEGVEGVFVRPLGTFGSQFGRQVGLGEDSIQRLGEGLHITGGGQD